MIGALTASTMMAALAGHLWVLGSAAGAVWATLFAVTILCSELAKGER